MAHIPGHQTEEQRQATFAAANLTQEQRGAVTAGIQAPKPMTVGGLVDTEVPFEVPEKAPEEDLRGGIDVATTSLQDIVKQFSQPLPEETTGITLQEEILKSMDILGGRREAIIETEAEAGIPETETQLMGVLGQLQTLQKESAAIPLSVAEEFEGRAGVRVQAGISESRLRKNAIKALGLSAIAQTLQGNLSIARASVDRAIELEFAPEERRLNSLRQFYAFNREALERRSKRRSDLLKIALNERTRILELEKNSRDEIYELGLLAQRFGATPDVVARMFGSGSKEDAVLAAGGFLQDPRMGLELKSLILNHQLKRLKIEEQRKINALIGEQTDKDTKADLEAMKQAEAALPVLENKVLLIKGLIDSSALDSVVGTGIFGRAAGGFGGIAGRFITGAASGAAIGAAFGAPFAGIGAIPGAIGGAIVGAFGLASQGAIDKSSGARQDFIGGVEQLISREFLDSLIAVKAQGATFGALQKAEQDALTQAASKIGFWRVRMGNRDDGQVIGYNASEASFKKELGILLDLTNITLTKARGNLFTEEERAVFDALDEVTSLLTTPGGYY